MFLTRRQSRLSKRSWSALVSMQQRFFCDDTSPFFPTPGGDRGFRGRRQASMNKDKWEINYGMEDRKVIQGLDGKSLLRIDDYSQKEFQAMLKLSRVIKQLYKSNALPPLLEGATMASIFQKRSTRTRVSTDTGMALLGGTSLFLSSEDIQLGVNESLKDSAMVLSRFNDLILARVFGHDIVRDLAKYSTVPIINALSDAHHPLQTLADYVTIQERFGPDNISGKTLCWIGDGNNVLHDLMLAAPMVGVNLKICTPENHRPFEDIVADTQALADKHGTSLKMLNDPLEAVKDSSIIVTDTWISMGQEEEAKERLKAFAGYQVTSELAQKGGAADDWIFMHCLPRHQEEVSDEVFYSDRSVVFDEAENRMCTVMAVIASMCGEHF